MPVMLHPDRWQRVLKAAADWVDSGQTTAISCTTGITDGEVAGFHFGTCDVGAQRPLPEEPIYLVASITKPILALGVSLLIERGLITLGTRISDVIPEFGRQGKYGVELRHLLTHTSGLPDMLPDNEELRAAHAPLSVFLKETCEIPLLFSPGKAVQYQSMGFVVLAELVTRLAGRDWRQFLQEEIFNPLAMSNSWLGVPNEWFAEPSSEHLQRLVDVRLTPAQAAATDWNWNSRYWRQLGAPWGGLLTTAGDLARLSMCLLSRGRTPSGHVLLSPASVAAATRNQLEPMRDIPEADRRTRSWGLGWRLHWPGHSANFGDLLGPATYGHWGATGTVLWIDPDQEIFAVILTSQPQEPAGWFISRLSNMVAASWT